MAFDWAWPGMKRQVFAGLLLLVLSGVIWLVLARMAPSNPVIVSLPPNEFADDTNGQRMVVLPFRNIGSIKAVLVPQSFDYKVGAGWITNQPIPQTLAEDMSMIAAPPPQEIYGSWVHFPTNATWRLRLEVVEQRRGLPRLLEYVKYSWRFYRRTGKVLGRSYGRYTGRSYYLETAEIPYVASGSP